jgi:tungstate transport system ATP-binding protein
VTISQIKANKLTKKFDGLTALNQASLRAESGRITAVVGVNGSGKTTLLRLLAGLDVPSEGDILIDERTLASEELRGLCTMVFQKSIMLGGKVYDNIAYGLRVNRVPREELPEKVKTALGHVNLEGFEKRKARKLSSGEQQRVALARALALERAVLLIDEPTANLDPANTTIIEQSVKQAARSRVIILTTHNLAQAGRMADSVVHLHGGSIVEQSETHDFFNKPSDERTRLFINGELQF